MSKLLEAIREGSKARRMRMGQNVADFVSLRSNPEIRMAMVPLLEVENELAWSAASAVEVGDNTYGAEVRDRVLKVNTLYYALRQPDNSEERVFESPEQLKNELEEIDINYLGEQYQALIDYASPSIEGLTDEQVAELKKALEEIDWNALSGKPWWHLKAFFMTLTVDQLRGKSQSRSSILSLIGTSDENVFTPGAEQS